MIKLIIMFAIYVCLSAGGLVLFKLGSSSVSAHVGSDGFSFSTSWYMILGILCYAVSFILWLFIVSGTDLSIAMPLSVGIVNILVLLGSKFILNENVSIAKWIGCLVIIIGLFIINSGDKIAKLIR